MNKKIKILIVGFGNLGRCAYWATPCYPDLECVGIVSRNPLRVEKEIVLKKIHNDRPPIIALADINGLSKLGAEVAILCGGSKEDLPTQSPFFASRMNIVDSFDTHGYIPEYEKAGQPMLGHLKTVDLIARQTKHTAHVCVGWDPGSFSLMRAYFTATMGGAKAYAFYGLSERGGLSMGHSNAIRDNVPGVLDARSYTHAIPEAIERVRLGKNPAFSPGEMHWRENLVVAAPGADQAAIVAGIKNMPEYFLPYRTEVKFISAEEMKRDYSDTRHDGLVIAVNEDGVMEFKNVWKSNPSGTVGIMLAYARATVRLNQDGIYGAFSALDTPVSRLLSAEVDGIRLI